MKFDNLDKKKVAGWVILSLVAAMIIFSGIMKFTVKVGSDQMEMFTQLGFGGHLPLIALGEIVTYILLLIPVTASLGFILAIAHAGGMVATHLTHDVSIVFPAVLLVLVFVGQFLRDSSILNSFYKKSE